MKLSTRPISSPGRTDKFPPPLMRFLRNNAGSRSRGRSRSTTMFLRKKNTAIETQEPSSPKVTCMGQVRVKRSSKHSSVRKGRSVAGADAGAPTKRRCCKWVPNALFFHRLIKPGSCFHWQCQPVWPNWGFLRRKKKVSKFTEASPKTELNFRGSSYDESGEEESEHEERVINSAFVSNSCSTPPRNALLLTRCRSAPYSSSSLASRFWSEETGVESREASENERPSSQKSPKLELKLRFFKELEDSLRERIMESEKVLKRREEAGEDTVRPLVLTRCKSEPARIAKKLDPEVNNFWKKTRLGFADAWFPHGL
ncbi:uncharacterized protein LOC113873451 [Abrus precatorius]|uniref:Uncharacterized protein LOC113873451 n=1 Tax=Abrus precatorius TaxID=3816 RepID=A0A8B8MIA9_ABRPR|nr:uncharacterized protein LOC113873451 [Abrus precatorius]